MAMDIRIDTEDKGFKCRVCGLVIVDNKILVQKIKDNKFYCLPGGHVEFGEDTVNTVVREMKEETEKDFIVESLMVLNENFFMHANKEFHELGFYYKLKPKYEIDLENYERIEIDKGIPKKLKFEWINIDDLDKIDFRPSFLIEKLKKRDYKLEHKITRGI